MINAYRAAMLAAATLLAVAPSAGAALPQRTFVASTGADTNPCSLTAPCRSFGVAIAAVAANGEVVVIDTAGYGPFIVTQSVAVVAPTGVYAGISVLGGDGVTINAPGAIVALRGLAINGQGGSRGIVVTAAASVHVDGCTVSNLSGSGVVIDANASVEMAGTLIRNVGDGILVNNGALTATGVQIRETGGRGIDVTNGSAVIRDSVVTKTGGIGIIAEASAGKTSKVTVERTTVSFTGFEGLLAYGNGGPATLVAVDNVISDNSAFSGIVAVNAGSTVRASGNTVTRIAGSGLFNTGGTLFESAQDNFVQGNGSPTSGTITNVGKF